MRVQKWMVKPDASVIASGGWVVHGVSFGFARVIADFVSLATDDLLADLQGVKGWP